MPQSEVHVLPKIETAECDTDPDTAALQGAAKSRWAHEQVSAAAGARARPSLLRWHSPVRGEMATSSGDTGTSREVRLAALPIWTAAPHDAKSELQAASPSPLPRLSYSPDESARVLGVSRSLFYASIMPELRTVRVGRKRLVPVKELEEWLTRNASRALP